MILLWRSKMLSTDTWYKKKRHLRILHHKLYYWILKLYMYFVGVRTLRTFATSYPGHFLSLQGTKWLLTLLTLDTSYLVTRYFVPRTMRVLNRDSCIVYDYVVLCVQIKSNQITTLCWDQGAILNIARLLDFKLIIKIK